MLQVVRGCPQLRVLNGLLLDGIQRLNKFWQRLQVTFKVFNGVSDFLKYTTNLNTEQGILTHTYVFLAVHPETWDLETHRLGKKQGVLSYYAFGK